MYVHLIVQLQIEIEADRSEAIAALGHLNQLLLGSERLNKGASQDSNSDDMMSDHTPKHREVQASTHPAEFTAM